MLSSVISITAEPTFWIQESPHGGSDPFVRCCVIKRGTTALRGKMRRDFEGSHQNGPTHDRANSGASS